MPKTTTQKNAAYNKAFEKMTDALHRFADIAADNGPPIKSISFSQPGSNGATRSIKVRFQRQ